MNHLTLRGTHREMGFQWGARLAERGLRLLDHVPFPLEAERRAFAAACRPAYARHFPAALEELEGNIRAYRQAIEAGDTTTLVEKLSYSAARKRKMNRLELESGAVGREGKKPKV